jgi:hypothetical protein
MHWFLPSFHGDIRLTADGEKIVVRTLNLSEMERSALRTLRQKWHPQIPEAFEETSFTLEARVEVLQKRLSKLLKPGRTLVSVVTFSGGRVEEVRDVVVPKDATAAVTVAEPTRGCPVPEFHAAEIAATEVLRTFLNPAQLEDFERRQQFVAVGADTGHRYMLTSRSAPDRTAKTGGRSLYDLDEEQAYCVHDWTVPSAEELLSLSMFVQLPGRESYLRELVHAPEGA